MIYLTAWILVSLVGTAVACRMIKSGLAMETPQPFPLLALPHPASAS